MKKRFLSMLMALIMVIGLLPMAAFAEESILTPENETVGSEFSQITISGAKVKSYTWKEKYLINVVLADDTSKDATVSISGVTQYTTWKGDDSVVLKGGIGTITKSRTVSGSGPYSSVQQFYINFSIGEERKETAIYPSNEGNWLEEIIISGVEVESYVWDNNSSASVVLKPNTKEEDMITILFKTDGGNYKYTEKQDNKPFVEGITSTFSNLDIGTKKPKSFKINFTRAEEEVEEYNIFSNIYIENGFIYTPAKLSQTEYKMVMNKGSESASYVFKLNEEIFSSVSIDGIELLPDENGEYKVTFSSSEFASISYGFADEKTVKVSGEHVNKDIILKVYVRNDNIDEPDFITDYFPLNSQYTNGGNQLTGLYGLEPEKSLLGLGYWWSPISCGNFGGYITYYYEDAIEDDPNNPYGIDFIVYGNSNGGTEFSEPGQVYVSEDGEHWYALAGSRHFDDDTEWNRVLKYFKGDNGNTYRQVNGGEPVQINASTAIPTVENYPLHYKNGEWDSFEVGGVMLTPRAGENMEAAYPEWGYADVKLTCATSAGIGTIASLVSNARNPYWPQPTYNSAAPSETIDDEVNEFGGDGMDLAWAVDENGQPVTFANGIHYIKIQTATYGSGATATGEKSTEVNCLARAKANDSAVGVTAAPSAITVDGKEVKLKNGVYTYSLGVEGEFDVEVAADENANIYINSTRGNVLSFDAVPEHGIVRVIVQEDEKEPVIYYLKIVERTEEVKAVEELISAIGNVTLDSEEAIEAARDAYDALTEDQKSIVENYDVLAAAERTLAMLKNRDTVTIVIASKDYTASDGEVNPETGAPVLNLGVLAVLCCAAVLIKFNRQ